MTSSEDLLLVSCMCLKVLPILLWPGSILSTVSTRRVFLHFSTCSLVLHDTCQLVSELTDSFFQAQRKLPHLSHSFQKL
ncbi:unnamed protein product [Haemonchus placei]|uniref:Secreted protein n=1 Tax=Haemonchus placei TaxID=6290 RepID=A0A0N4VY49_HAEPC|nr:unnamed protein product [Haemonchus placei]